LRFFTRKKYYEIITFLSYELFFIVLIQRVVSHKFTRLRAILRVRCQFSLYLGCVQKHHLTTLEYHSIFIVH